MEAYHMQLSINSQYEKRKRKKKDSSIILDYILQDKQQGHNLPLKPTKTKQNYIHRVLEAPRVRLGLVIID